MRFIANPLRNADCTVAIYLTRANNGFVGT